MLVGIDIGNTNITLGLYREDELISTFRITTKWKRTSDEYGTFLVNFLHETKVRVTDIEDVIVSSVVPKIMHSFNNSIRKYLKKEPIIIGPGIKTGISIKTDDPRSIGSDRIVDLVGALHEYGAPALIVDFGTATTFDFLGSDGSFEYGVIAPGIEISAQALWTHAAKLFEVEIKKPSTILTKDTVSAMQAGIVYGYIGQVEYIIKTFKETLGCDMKVIATGGLSRILENETTSIDHFDPNLTFKGLKIIYDLYVKNQKNLKSNKD